MQSKVPVVDKVCFKKHLISQISLVYKVQESFSIQVLSHDHMKAEPHCTFINGQHILKPKTSWTDVSTSFVNKVLSELTLVVILFNPLTWPRYKHRAGHSCDCNYDSVWGNPLQASSWPLSLWQRNKKKNIFLFLFVSTVSETAEFKR